jgi:hypothetical protein
MQSKKSCDHYDHDHHADDVKNIHCIAPVVEQRLGIGLPPLPFEVPSNNSRDGMSRLLA